MGGGGFGSPALTSELALRYARSGNCTEAPVSLAQMSASVAQTY